MVGQLAPEQPVHPVASVVEVDPQPADQEQVRLPGFDHQPGGMRPLPSRYQLSERDVGLGPDRAGSRRGGSAVDAGHPVHQQHGGFGQPDLAATAVLSGEPRTEQVGDIAPRQVLKLIPAELRAGTRAWRRSRPVPRVGAGRRPGEGHAQLLAGVQELRVELGPPARKS